MNGAQPWAWPWWLEWIPVRLGLGGTVSLPAVAVRLYTSGPRRWVYLTNGQLWRVRVLWLRIGVVLVTRARIPVLAERLDPTPVAPPVKA